MIENITFFPPAFKFEPIFDNVDYVECMAVPQYRPTICIADIITERILGNDDICEELTPGALIWKASPLFDITDGEHCYQNLCDTIPIAPCPVYPSNGIPSIKVLRK